MKHEAQTKLQLGVAALREGRGREAEILLHQAFLHHPEDPEVLFWRGLADRQPSSATAYLARALRRTPEALSGRRALARDQIERIHRTGTAWLPGWQVELLRHRWRASARAQPPALRWGRSLAVAALLLALSLKAGAGSAAAATRFAYGLPDRLAPYSHLLRLVGARPPVAAGMEDGPEILSAEGGAGSPASPHAAEGPEPAAETAPPPVVHEVSRGETLGRIARRYGVEVGAIVEANGLSNPNVLRVGQKLIIPIPGD